jgi:uncharacterized Zn finger protein (UPF0148 family)
MLMSDAPGFPCPVCKKPITTNLATLFSGQVHCPACGLELRLDPAASSEALTAAHRLDDAIQRAETLKAEALGVEHLPAKRPERPRSRPRRP